MFGTNEEIASKIQEQVFNETGIVTTIGIGPNPLLAKLALDNAAKQKSPWQAYWGYEDIPNTTWKISRLTDFWSIGDRTALRSERIGIHSIYELAHSDPRKLHKESGVI